ncbi:phage integrase N-terminal SAM-like domain-containing protein [Vibrio salinus]|uniref:phage integrase N-terminal SAM-like domain-containing protein n=1 Tax=Vibrio salinus TaxID=2899784 RepID=UPI001E4FE19E|nr:phage integrase N-terminal SAM-like domain-containing protein [Vibrio salinus]MCE0495179.1 phage integrase N-terminal SAM-like domain-containing protein [Vibrio salinus]
MGRRDGKQIFRRNSTIYANAGNSLKTEKAHLYWIKYFIRFNKLKHPKDIGEKEVTGFLSYLANEQYVAINT